MQTGRGAGLIGWRRHSWRRHRWRFGWGWPLALLRFRSNSSLSIAMPAILRTASSSLAALHHSLLGPAPTAASYHRAAARAALCLLVAAVALLGAQAVLRGSGGSASRRVLQGPPEALPLRGCSCYEPEKLSRAVGRMLRFDLLAAPLVPAPGTANAAAEAEAAEAAALHSRLCGLCDGKSVAVVGNGPLGKAQRVRIAGADTIMRFNRLGLGWHPGDRADILMLRHREHAPPEHPFFLPHVPNHANASLPAGCLEEGAAVLTSTALLLAAGNTRFDVPLSDLPKVAAGAGLPAGALDAKLARLPTSGLARRFKEWGAEAAGGVAPNEPSSGLLGECCERWHWHAPAPNCFALPATPLPDLRPTTSVHADCTQASSLC